MRRPVSFFAGSLSLLVFTAVPAMADPHNDDIIVGVSSTGVLKIEFNLHDHIDLYPISPGIPGVYEGFADDDPGFDHLEVAEPAEDFFPLADGADIWLVGVSLDAGLKVRNPTNLAVAIDSSGGSIRLGDDHLHTHVIWHIDSLDPGFNPAQDHWDGTFKLVDFGTTGYGDSAPFTLEFVAIPEPATAVLLAFGSVWMLRRRRC